MIVPLSTEPTWRLAAPGYLPALERAVETRLTVSNGALGTRGSLEAPTCASQPGTKIAGLFVREPLLPEVPVLASGPNWLRLRVWLDGDPLELDLGTVLDHQRTLDLRYGLMHRSWQHVTPGGGEVLLRTLRGASQATRALAFQIAEIEVTQPLYLVVDAWLEPPPTALFVAEHRGRYVQTWRTADGTQQLAVASALVMRLDAQTLEPGTSPATHLVSSAVLPPGDVLPDRLARRWEWTAVPGQRLTLTRLVVMTRCRCAEQAAAAPAHHALGLLRHARNREAPLVVAEHARAWRTRWRAADITVEGDEAMQVALRFALYHLISAANPAETHVSIGARALTGDAYLGHVFWDTDIFVLPFFTCTWPRASRALLLYRYHCLPAARAKAAHLGYRGALYAWESADTGDEVTPDAVLMPDGQVVPVLTGRLEQHISADVAYAVWQYWQATEDAGFLLQAGAEIVVETARFWASRACLEADGRYHIRGVIGPDEYHEKVDDNAYTNVMARWNLERGVEVANMLEARWPRRWAALQARLGIDDGELAQWRAVAAGLVTGLDERSGLIEQFSGFFDLEQIDLAAYTPRTAPMDVLLGRARTQRAQVLKQADVVMLLALLWECFPQTVRAANFRYYEPRTAHGSSLSPPIHALVAARLGDVTLAERYLVRTAAIDLDDTMNNAAQGIHIAAQGGLWQAVVFGFGGVRYRSDGLELDPHLPSAWQRLTFSLQWRGRWVAFEIGQQPLMVTATLRHARQGASTLVLRVRDLQHHLLSGETWRCQWNERTGRWVDLSGRPEHPLSHETPREEVAP